MLVNYADIRFNPDGTPVSNQFDDIYFSTADALAETEYVFLAGNRLWERWQQSQAERFIIAETGFGSGLNFFATIALFRRFRTEFPTAPLKRLFFISFEKYPLNPQDLQLIHQQYPQFNKLSQQLIQHWPQPLSGCYRLHFAETTLDLWLGDVAENLPALGDYMQNKVDAWFLDGFAPAKNPEMWNEHLFQQLARVTATNGSFATFTAASTVRKGLLAAGFHVEKRPGFGHKRECLGGVKPQSVQQPSATPWFNLQAAQMPTQDIAIVGGGIASLCTALALLQRGATVTLYCADDAPALNASGNKQGAFYPQLSDDNVANIRFYLHTFSYGGQLLHWLLKQGIEFEHAFCGVALSGYNAKAEEKLRKIAELHLPSAIYQPMEQKQLSAAVGLPLPCGGGFIPLGGWLAPRQLVQNAFAYLQQQGLTIQCQQTIQSLSQTTTGWRLTNTQGATFEHEVVVLANGHQLNHFAQTEKLPLYPVRGQVSQIPTSANLLKLNSVLCYDGYLTPVDQAGESHCIGASHVRDSADRTFSAQEQVENQHKIQHNIPEDWTQEVDTSGNLARIGVRCSVRDLSPMAGNVPNFAAQNDAYRNLFNLRRRKQPIPAAENYPNLYLIGALGSRGLTSAPLLGEMLASLIYGDPLPLDESLQHCLSANRSWVRKWLKGAPVE